MSPSRAIQTQGCALGKLRACSGFTLLEVLITLVILSVGMLALASLQVMAIRGNSFGQQMTVASTVAQNKLEELREVDFSAVASGYDTCRDDANGILYTRQWTVQNDTPQPDMKTVRVSVTWTGCEAGRSVAVSTIIGRL